MPVLYETLRQWLAWGPAWDPWISAVAIAVPCLIAFLLIQAIAGASTYVERKVAADIQRRVGPNQCNLDPFLGEFIRACVANASRPGAGILARLMAALLKPGLPLFAFADRLLIRFAPGVLIFLADGIKLILKEDITPAAVDVPLFRMAPAIVLASAFAALAALPYSDAFFIADFNIGLFYIAAVTSIEVLGILMAGWASNNKWALLGGMRSAAQIVSYELPAAITIATVVLLSGSFSLQAITIDQFHFSPGGGWFASGWVWQWNLFHPALFILFPAFFLAALAECNRTPFDIPEAESELVSGYHTEYSGMRFAFFFMGEYAMMCATSAIAVAIFFGGWSTGIAPLERLLMTEPPRFDASGALAAPPVFHWAGSLLHLAVFLAKTYALVLIMMWIRWTLPRFRVDQMMELCWKKLIPIGLFCFTFTALGMLLRMPLAARFGAESVDGVAFALRLAFFVAVSAWLAWFFMKPLSPEQQRARALLAPAPA